MKKHTQFLSHTRKAVALALLIGLSVAPALEGIIPTSTTSVQPAKAKKTTDETAKKIGAHLQHAQHHLKVASQSGNSAMNLSSLKPQQKMAYDKYMAEASDELNRAFDMIGLSTTKNYPTIEATLLACANDPQGPTLGGRSFDQYLDQYPSLVPVAHIAEAKMNIEAGILIFIDYKGQSIGADVTMSVSSPAQKTQVIATLEKAQEALAHALSLFPEETQKYTNACIQAVSLYK